SISSGRISSIIQDKNGTVWIGTFNKGLNKVSEEKEGLKFTAYRNNTLYPGTIPSDNVFKLFKDKHDNLWIITGGRFLSEFNYDTEEFTTYQIDSSELHSQLEFLSISEDESGNLWLGTAGRGLIKFNTKTKSFLNSDNPFILRDKSVYGILFDKLNCSWISTNFGLIKYNIADQSALNFNISDGLQSLKYTGACLNRKNGEMFFGGINGFNCFFPDSIRNEKILPEIIITSLIVSNIEIPFTGRSIHLNSSENSFSINFTSTDYTDPLKNQYLYMLEGYDNKWSYASGNIHSAEYKGLPAGSYIFKVKGTGSSGIWTDKPATLGINIPAVFWKTWWFISIWVLIFTALISYSIFYRFRQFLIIEKLKTKLSADLHDSVGSGLTEISLLCEIVRRDYKNELKKDNLNLSLIAQKSRELVDNMSDIVWLVNPKQNTLYDLMLRLKDIYSPIINSRGTIFKVEISDSIKDFKMDVEKRQNIYLIFKEGINNSIKYSKAKNILLKLETAEDSVKIILKDDGCGFDIDFVKGNGLINMKRRAENLKADFAIHTSQGKGTSIVLEWKE
ncbi:MAG TPA: triple tyrosine motif-containing protein, partial [Ignavibacteriaceae bacterium]|nr:triple tyrosine motif-containing protein [Ignavibacteriaceae bacterium]